MVGVNEREQLSKETQTTRVKGSIEYCEEERVQRTEENEESFGVSPIEKEKSIY